LVKPFWVLGIDRVVQNNVGSAEYGLYFSLFNLSILFNIILDFGLTNFNNRNISQHKQLLPKYFSNIVVLKFLLAFVYAIITIIFGIIFGYDLHKFYILLFLIFNQFLLSFVLYLRSNISGLQLFRMDSLISVLDRVLMIAICSILLWGNIFKQPFKIEWFIYSQTIAYFLTAIVAFFAVLKYSKFLKLRINRPFLIAVLKQSLPYALLVLLMSIHNRVDAILLVRLLPNGAEQSGIYAQSFRLLDATTQFSLLFAGLLLPMFSKMLNLKQNPNELVLFSFFLLITPAIILVVNSMFFNREIIDLLYTEHNILSAKVFSVLISTLIPISITYIFGTLLTANGSIRYLNIIAFIGVVVSLLLNIILIPKLQALGTAYSAVFTQSITALLQMILSFYFFKIKISTKKIIAFLFFIVALIITTYFIHLYIYNWLIAISLSIAIGIILGFLLKMINIKTIFVLLKSNEE